MNRPHLAGSKPQTPLANHKRQPQIADHEPMTSTMESIMRTYLTIPSRKPTCLVEQVMVMLFHDIAAIFLTFTILNWIFDSIWYRILGSRWIRKWSRRLRRRPVYIFGIVCGRVGLALIKILKILDYVLARVQDALRGLVLYVAESNLILVNLCLTVGDMDVEQEEEGCGKQTKKKEVKEEASYSSAVIETAVKSAPKATFKPVIKTCGRLGGRLGGGADRPRVETSLKEDPNRNWSNEHGNLSPQRLRVEKSLEDNPDRNWSNEHGNLSPGSSPTAHSTSSTYTVRPVHCADPTRPLRCERPNPSRMINFAGPGPSDLSSSIPRSVLYKPKGSEVTSSEPKCMSTAYKEYSRNRAHMDYRRALLEPHPSDATSESAFEESATPSSSTSSNSDGSIDTPSAGSSSSDSVHTPSSTRNPDPEDSSSRGVLTPTSTTSSESEVMASHTPPPTDSPDSEDSTRPGTPDSASSSESDQTVVHTPSP